MATTRTVNAVERRMEPAKREKATWPAPQTTVADAVLAGQLAAQLLALGVQLCEARMGGCFPLLVRHAGHTQQLGVDVAVAGVAAGLHNDAPGQMAIIKTFASAP